MSVWPVEVEGEEVRTYNVCQVEKPHCTVIGGGSLYIRYQTCNPIILYIFTSLLKGDLIAELDNGKKKEH